MFLSSETIPADVQGRQWQQCLLQNLPALVCLFRDHFEGVQLWLTCRKSLWECRILGGQHKHKPQVKVLSLSQLCSHLICTGRNLCSVQVLERDSSSSVLLLLFLPGCFLTSMCSMHNQHLRGAAVGKRKLTRNTNRPNFRVSQCSSSPGSWQEPAERWKPRPPCVVCKGGTLGDITRVSRAEK